MLVATKDARKMLRYIKKHELIRTKVIEIGDFIDRYAKLSGKEVGEVAACFNYLSTTKYIRMLKAGESSKNDLFTLSYAYYHWFTFAVVDILNGFVLKMLLPIVVSFLTAFITTKLIS